MKRIFLFALVIVTVCYARIGHADPAANSGTAFLINTEGWFVTNAHVLEGCSVAMVPGVGGATNWIIDRHNDIAAFKVPAAAGRPYLRLREQSPRLGEDIVAFGFPYAGYLSDTVKVTTGNVNSLIGAQNDIRYLQVSAPLQPGNSGGPVVDREGSVVGIATAVYVGDESFVPQNVNFAVRSSVLQIFLASHRIGFELYGFKGDPLPTPDLADLVSPSVVAITCHDQHDEEQVYAPLATSTGSAILYQERLGSIEGTADSGSVVWSFEQQAVEPSGSADPLVRAKVDIPAASLKCQMDLTRNRDVSLPADHLIMLICSNTGFGEAQVAKLVGVSFKDSEQATGNRLTGAAAKISDGFFIFALEKSAANIERVVGNDWIDLPIIYTSGRRALITLQKGASANAIIAEAIRIWGGSRY